MPNDREKDARVVYMDRPGSLHLAGDGLCEEICPDIFFAGDNGLFYVKDVGERANAADPRLRMGEGLAFVPDRLTEAAIEAAEDCP